LDSSGPLVPLRHTRAVRADGAALLLAGCHRKRLTNQTRRQRATGFGDAERVGGVDLELACPVPAAVEIHGSASRRSSTAAPTSPGRSPRPAPAWNSKCTKTGKSRKIKIPASAQAAVEEHRKRQDVFRAQCGDLYRAGDLIFANPDGSPLKPDSMSSAVSLLFRRLKLPKGVSLHSLRHTHVSQLLDDGVPLTVVSARLGHSSVRTTQEIYAHMIHGQDDEGADRWDEYQKRHAAPAVAGARKDPVQ